MKWKYIIAGTALWACMSSAALAAYNDVSLSNGTVLTVGGITVNVSASTASIESIVVGASSFTVVLQANSTLTVDAPGLNMLVPDSTTVTNMETVCTATDSKLSFGSTNLARTVVITPSATLCDGTNSGSSGSGGSGGSHHSSSSSSSGGGSSSGSTSSTMTTTTSTTQSDAAIAAQIKTLLATIASLQAQLGLTGTVSAGSTGFTRNLTVGSTGADVMALQQWLNAHGFTVAVSGAGSAGHETMTFGGATQAALAKYQASVGITPPAGYFGAKTRAYLAAH